MKITFILPSLNLSGGVISTVELANNLVKRDNDVTIIYPVIILRPRLEWYNLRSIAKVLSTRRRQERLLLNRIVPQCRVVTVPTLRKNFIPNGDAIIATWWETAYYLNGYSPEKGMKFYFVRGYEVWSADKELVDRTYSFPLKIITTSTSLRNLLKSALDVDVIGTVPNGVNFSLFYKAKAERSPNCMKRIGMVYRGFKWKGMRDGFEAFRIAKQSVPDSKLVLFGSPAGDDVPDDVEFHEHPDVDTLRALYNSLDVFILPSHPEEGFANPPMEAMACGVPCVLTNVGGVPDYTIHGKTAVVVNPNDSRALAESLIHLLADDKLRHTIAQAGYEHIRNFSWEKSAATLENILKEHITGT
jgi:glycosyltransferase involved in cell wall biosynthesis